MIKNDWKKESARTLKKLRKQHGYTQKQLAEKMTESGIFEKPVLSAYISTYENHGFLNINIYEKYLDFFDKELLKVVIDKQE